MATWRKESVSVGPKRAGERTGQGTEDRAVPAESVSRDSGQLSLGLFIFAFVSL